MSSPQSHDGSRVSHPRNLRNHGRLQISASGASRGIRPKAGITNIPVRLAYWAMTTHSADRKTFDTARRE